jgi:hypothetical protein
MQSSPEVIFKPPRQAQKRTGRGRSGSGRFLLGAMYRSLRQAEKRTTIRTPTHASTQRVVGRLRVELVGCMQVIRERILLPSL